VWWCVTGGKSKTAHQSVSTTAVAFVLGRAVALWDGTLSSPSIGVFEAEMRANCSHEPAHIPDGDNPHLTV